MTDQQDSLVTVLTASLIHETHIAKTLLANQGIESFIFDENITSTIGTAYVEGYKLKVRASDAKKASAIIDEIMTEE